MKNYKMMLSSAGFVALLSIGCATGSQANDPGRVASQDACEVHNQNMRPQWKATAVRTAPGEVMWRPQMKKSDSSQEVVAHTFRPGLRETNLAAATCIEPGQATY